MLQLESLLKQRGGFAGKEAGQRKQLMWSGEAILGGRGAQTIAVLSDMAAGDVGRGWWSSIWRLPHETITL